MSANFVSISTIIHACSVVFGVRVRDIRSPSRVPEICAARGAAALLANELLEIGTPTVGRALMRDHATILQAMRQARRRCARDAEYAGKIEQARQALKLVASVDLARLLNSADAVIAARRICHNPFVEATRASALETAAMAMRLVALEELAARCFELVLKLAGAPVAASAALIADLAVKLLELGYAQEDNSSPANKEPLNV